ncbi:hypothetical protein KIPB_010249, partial [Kipferlia bialata]
CTDGQIRVVTGYESPDQVRLASCIRVSPPVVHPTLDRTPVQSLGQFLEEVAPTPSPSPDDTIMMEGQSVLSAVFGTLSRTADSLHSNENSRSLPSMLAHSIRHTPSVMSLFEPPSPVPPGQTGQTRQREREKERRSGIKAPKRVKQRPMLLGKASTQGDHRVLYAAHTAKRIDMIDLVYEQRLDPIHTAAVPSCLAVHPSGDMVLTSSARDGVTLYDRRMEHTRRRQRNSRQSASRGDMHLAIPQASNGAVLIFDLRNASGGHSNRQRGLSRARSLDSHPLSVDSGLSSLTQQYQPPVFNDTSALSPYATRSLSLGGVGAFACHSHFGYCAAGSATNPGVDVLWVDYQASKGSMRTLVKKDVGVEMFSNVGGV